MAKFAVRYRTDNQYLSEVDEIIIKYHPSKTLIDFLKEHSNQRIIISVEDGQAFSKEMGVGILTLIKQNLEDPKNWVVRLPSLFDQEKAIPEKTFKQLQEMKIPYFFNDYVDRWDILYGLFDLGVTDVYVCNELGFELDKVAAAAHKRHIGIRVFPNIAQSAWYKTSDLKKFFIRPEDIEDYEPFVDTFEIFVNEDVPTNVDQTLYKIYAKDQKWFGKLNEIISNFDNELDGRFTHPLWVSNRISCGKRCLKGGHCRMCDTIANLGDTLKKVGVTVEKPDPVELPTEEEFDNLVDKYYKGKQEPFKWPSKQKQEELTSKKK